MLDLLITVVAGSYKLVWLGMKCFAQPKDDGWHGWAQSMVVAGGSRLDMVQHLGTTQW